MPRGVRRRSTGSDPGMEALAKRLESRAATMRRNVAELHKVAAREIAYHVVHNTPVWSGQARLNWTAHVGTRKPSRRFVNVPRSNSRLVHAPKGKTFGKIGDTSFHTKVRTGTQGSARHITPDPRIRDSAASTAMAAIDEVIQTQYKHPVPFDQGGKKTQGRRIAHNIYISNSIRYIGKLWSGRWASNPRTLDTQLDYGSREIRRRGSGILSNR